MHEICSLFPCPWPSLDSPGPQLNQSPRRLPSPCGGSARRSTTTQIELLTRARPRSPRSTIAYHVARLPGCHCQASKATMELLVNSSANSSRHGRVRGHGFSQYSVSVAARTWH